jgi:colicin import membrane protein
MAGAPAVSWEFFVAGIGHVLLFGVVAFAHCAEPDAPLFKPEDTLQVALAGPPKNDTRMPQKAERAPPPPKASAPDAPTPPPPPNPSDMAFKTPDAPKTKGDPTADANRQRVLDDLRRRQAIQDLSAPEGREDRLASNPDGSADAGSSSTAGINDPALAKWITEAKRRITPNWHPLPSLLDARPKLVVIIGFEVGDDGRIAGAPEIKKSSGNRSYDESARRAVEMTVSVGKLPDKYAGSPIALTFSPEDAQ